MYVAISAVIAIAAVASVGEVGAFMRVELRAIGTLLAVADGTEGLAVEGFGVEANMCKPAVIPGAAGVLEVMACRCVVRSGVVRKRAGIALGARAFEQPALADRLLVRIMNEVASMMRTDTYTSVRHTNRGRRSRG